MTKEELKQEAEEKYFNHKMMEFQGFYNRHYYYLGYLDSAEPREKRIAELEKEIAELEEKISVLLSCKNCSKNKGGWICAKEYENKCLAQKIVFIQELKKENAELKKELKISQRCWQDQKNISLNANCSLHKAKEIIKDFILMAKVEHLKDRYETVDEAEQFIKDSEVKK